MFTALSPAARVSDRAPEPAAAAAGAAANVGPSPDGDNRVLRTAPRPRSDSTWSPAG